MSLWPWLSYLWPVRVARVAGRHGPLDLTWENGRLVVNSPNANQSYGSLHRVWRQALADADVQQLDPKRVLILGFGAGSAAHILRDELGMNVHITGVDHDPAMLAIARQHFGWEPGPRLDLVAQEAEVFLHAAASAYDLILVDLFADNEAVPVVSQAAFIRHLHGVAPTGRVLVNTMTATPAGAALSARSGQELRHVFSSVTERRYERDNRVFIAL